MNQIRLDRMKAYIEQKTVVTIKELQELFPEVSLMTIHRDLDALVDAGSITKFRGGAKAVRHDGDPEFNVRIAENNSGKFAIAQKAMQLLQPHSSVFDSIFFVDEVRINAITFSSSLGVPSL